MKSVVVTGGSGLVGRRLQKICPEWIYFSSMDVDLTKSERFFNLLKSVNADTVVHLAAKTGGIKDNANNQSDFHYYNSLINLNVLKQSYQAGIKRVLSCLSTCCYPDESSIYPMEENQFLNGEPTETNFGYALAKRELFNQTNFYRRFYGANYSTFAPCNLYGPESNFDDNSSHFIASLIKKIYNCKHGGEIVLFGSGEPLRQHLYVDDLARIIPFLLEKHNTDIPINVATNENLSIKNIVEIALTALERKDIVVKFNGSLDGQYRKDVDNKKLISLIGEQKWTSLSEGIVKTYNWYAEKKGRE